MRVALVSPRESGSPYANGLVEDVHRRLEDEMAFLEMEKLERWPSLALLSVAAFFDDGDELSLFEEEYIPIDEVDGVIFGERWDLAAITAVDYQASRAYALADRFRAAGTPVVMGGMHATACPDEAALHADFLVLGEGEDTVPRFLRDFRAGKPRPRYVSRGDADLDESPMPRFDLLTRSHTSFDGVFLQATRGCPWHCTYCCLKEVYGKKYRKKSVARVVREVRAVKEALGAPFVAFADENMLVDRRYAKDLARALADEEILWSCFCDVTVADDDELLGLLRDSFCADLIIGFESLDEANLARECPWRLSHFPRYRQAIEKIQSYGIGVAGNFVVGFDCDGVSVFQELVDFAESTGLFSLDVGVLCPIPGTEIYARYDGEGRILTRRWERSTWIHCNFRPALMTPRQLEEGMLRLFVALNTPQHVRRREAHYRLVMRRWKAKKGARPWESPS